MNVATGAPATGWVRGQYQGRTLDLTVDRRAQSVSGQAAGASVSVATEAGGTHVHGSDGAPVDLGVAWQPDRYGLNGSARDGAVSVQFDWTARRGDGTVGDQPFHVQWDPSGHVGGTAFGGDVDLQYDPVSGNLQGALGHADLRATLTNLDLTEFMENVYLLAP